MQWRSFAGVPYYNYTNKFLRATYLAMEKCTERIFECETGHKASSELCMPIKDIIS